MADGRSLLNGRRDNGLSSQSSPTPRDTPELTDTQALQLLPALASSIDYTLLTLDKDGSMPQLKPRLSELISTPDSFTNSEISSLRLLLAKPMELITVISFILGASLAR